MHHFFSEKETFRVLQVRTRAGEKDAHKEKMVVERLLLYPE